MEKETVNQESANAPVSNKLLMYVGDNMPELEGASEDEKYDAVVDLLQKTKEFNDKMEELFSSEPLIGELLGGVMNGKKSFLGSMSEIMTPEEYGEALDGEGDDVLKNRKERLDKLKSYEDKQGIVEKNVAETQKNIEAWLDKKGWPTEKVQDFSDKVGQLFEIMSDGVLTEKELDALERMIYFDDMISSAREEGELTGRNAKIDTSRLEKVAQTATDGLPSISGGGGVAPEETKQPGYFDDVYNSAMERQRKLKG